MPLLTSFCPVLGPDGEFFSFRLGFSFPAEKGLFSPCFEAILFSDYLAFL